MVRVSDPRPTPPGPSMALSCADAHAAPAIKEAVVEVVLGGVVVVVGASGGDVVVVA